jgi:hypothetical protein
VGVEVQAGYAQHSEGLRYFEDLVECCAFDAGSGIPLRIAVIGEQWVTSQLSVQAGFGVTFQPTSFTVLAAPIPHERFGQVQTEYLFDVTTTQIALSIGARHRILSYLSIGLDLRGLIAAGSSTTLSERIVSPDDYYFSTNPPSKEYEWTNTVIGDLSAFVLEPAVTLQYDIALDMGMVLSPLVSVSMPVNSLSTEQSWRYVGLGFGVRLSRGL